ADSLTQIRALLSAEKLESRFQLTGRLLHRVGCHRNSDVETIYALHHKATLLRAVASLCGEQQCE
uniref:Transcriptional regulator n=1 Tax=Macrostomum lignano TaxID=282301 RepID=A0A1I8HX31_9PLAT